MYHCPLCGTVLTLSEDEIYFKCNECCFNEEFMSLEEEIQTI